MLNRKLLLLAGKSITPTPPIPDPGTMLLIAEITEAGQTVTVNRYFMSATTIDWGDGSAIVSMTSNITHTYTAIGEYTITLKNTAADKIWLFTDTSYVQLVPIAGTTADNIYVEYMDPLPAFVNAVTANQNSLLHYFNYQGALTRLAEGSFDMSVYNTGIRAAFYCFNQGGRLKSLPAGSFDTSNITSCTVEYFMFNFNYSGALESLPVGCFNTSNIVGNAGLGFFSNFNGNGGKLTRNTSSGVEIKNCYNGSTNYGYRNGTGTTNVSVPAGGTFQYYTAT